MNNNSSNNDACARPADQSRLRIDLALQELSLNPNITQQIEANAVAIVLRECRHSLGLCCWQVVGEYEKRDRFMSWVKSLGLRWTSMSLRENVPAFVKNEHHL